MKTLGSVINKPETPTPLRGKPGGKRPGNDERPSLEKLDFGDDKCEVIKVTGNQLNRFGNPDEKINEVNYIRTIFKDVDDDDCGINYYYRKVLGSQTDKPDKNDLADVPGETNIDEVYNNIKDDLKTPNDDVQLVKVVGNINPDEITKHMNEAKQLYDDQSQQPIQGTTDNVLLFLIQIKKERKSQLNLLKLQEVKEIQVKI